MAKKLAKAQGVVDYNVLQNNGAIAHQVVKHVHVHMIPKPNEEQGLVVGWPGTSPSKEELQAVRCSGSILFHMDFEGLCC